MSKILTWLKVNIASILGIAQAVIKAIKELLTAVVNLLSIFFPSIAMQKLVVAIRDILNKIDEYIEKIKPYLIPKVV